MKKFCVWLNLFAFILCWSVAIGDFVYGHWIGGSALMIFGLCNALLALDSVPPKRLIKWAFKKYCLTTMGCQFITSFNICPPTIDDVEKCDIAIRKYRAIEGAARDQLKEILKAHTEGTWVQEDE